MNDRNYTIAITVALIIAYVFYIVFSYVDGSKRLDRCECVVCDIQETDDYSLTPYDTEFGMSL